MLAYLWQDERLDGARISALFTAGRLDDLDTAATYLWSVSGQELTEKQVAGVLAFWRKGVGFVQGQNPPPVNVTCELSRLTCYLPSLDQDDGDRIVWLSAYADADQHSGWFFAKELERLVGSNPSAVAAALLAFVRNFRTGFDFENHILNTTVKLTEHGQIDAAIDIIELLKGLPKFQALYNEMH